MTEDKSKKVRVELDHEQKVVRLGCFFYDLKGVLIAEATEEDKKKYYYDRFMTYPIVDDDWAVREDDCLKDGIAALTIGKKGDTIPLIKLSEVLDLNVDERSGDYSDILIDVERHGITVSNRQEDNPQEELPEFITISDNTMKPTSGFTGRSLRSKPNSPSLIGICPTRCTMAFPTPSARTSQSTSSTTSLARWRPSTMSASRHTLSLIPMRH